MSNDPTETNTMSQTTRTLSLKTQSLDSDASKHGTVTIQKDPPKLDSERYTIQEELGKGGMGVVHAGYDVLLHRRVAIKSLRDNIASNSAEWQYFYREAQITAQLNHPSIVPVYSIEFDASHNPTLVMQQIDGISFKTFLQECQSAIGSEQFQEHRHGLHNRIEVLIHVCDALHYAHAKGIVHRDIKPDNIMLGRFEDVYVMDWGVATTIDAHSDTEEQEQACAKIDIEGVKVETEVGEIVGTLTYMPPEQARGKQNTLCQASDQFPIGYMLYELATFERARPATTKEELLTKAKQGTWDESLFSKHTKGIDPRLKAIIRRATAFEPIDRYPSMQVPAYDSRRYIQDQSVVALPEPKIQKVWRQLRDKPLLIGNVMAGIIILSLSLSLHSLQRSVEKERLSVLHRQQSAAMLNAISQDAQQIEGQMLLIQERIDVLTSIVEDELRTGTLGSPPSSTVDTLCSEPHTIPKVTQRQALPGYEHTWVHLASPLCVFADSPSTYSLTSLYQPLMKAFYGIDSTKEINSATESLLSGEPNTIEWAYIGFEDGTFMHYPGTSHFSDDFDPRQRPWYVHANHKRTTCTTLYKDYITSNTMLSCSRSFMDAKEENKGVVGMDIDLTTIQTWLAKTDFAFLQSQSLVHNDGTLLYTMNRSDIAVSQPPTDLLQRIAEGEHHGMMETNTSTWIFTTVSYMPWTLVYELSVDVWACADCF